MVRSLSPQYLNTFLSTLKLLQRHSQDTPQQPHSISEDKKQFYIYNHIKNLILIYFITHSVSFATLGVLSQCLITPATITELVTNTLTNMIVLIVAIQLSYLSVLLSENDPKLYFHTRRISFIYYAFFTLFFIISSLGSLGSCNILYW